MMTLTDKFNFFFREFLPQKQLSPSSQLIYLHILNIWNCHRMNANCFYLSDRELARSTNLSPAAVTQAKRVLKNFGLLTFHKVGGRTKYFLPDDELFTDNFTNSKQTADTDGLFGNSNKRYSTEPRTKKRQSAAKEKPVDNTINVEKNQAAMDELKRKIHPDISDEEKAEVRRRMAEIMKKFSMA